MKTEFIKCAFDEFLKVEYERMSETNLKVRLPIEPLYLNSVGIVHGGIICSLADIAMGNTFGIDENKKQTIVTADMNTTFLKGAKGEYLIADANIVKKGSRLSHVDCMIYDDNNELVAKAKGIFVSI